MYELIIIWDTGEKETHKYPSYEEAKEAGAGYSRAFGKQISYIGINDK